MEMHNLYPSANKWIRNIGKWGKRKKQNPSGLDATSQRTTEGLCFLLTDERWRCAQCLSMFSRYSDGTIEAVEMLDTDEKIDLELILALIRHIVLNEGVRVNASPVSAQSGIGFPFLK